MSSLGRILASRANRAVSTGPATDLGKRRSSVNATRLLEYEAAAQPLGDLLDRISNAFSDLASRPSLGLLHRYQTRLHLNYRRALDNMLLLRTATVPNEPSPIEDAAV